MHNLGLHQAGAFNADAITTLIGILAKLRQLRFDSLERLLGCAY